MIRVAVVGATGKTGQRVLDLAGREPGFEVVAALTAENDPWLRQTVRVGTKSVTIASETDQPFDVLIDFSRPAGAVRWCRRCFERGAAFVSGTTGLSDEQEFVLRLAAEKVPVLWAPNFSPGINLLQRLVGTVARELGEDYGIEIVEAHHDQKADAPSGTALSLARTIVEATGRDMDTDVVHGRCGQVGPRPRRQIGMHALRMGDDVGWHEIHFGGPGETLVFRHTVRSRDAFARGALAAARWVVGRKPGFYSMQAVLAAGRTR